MNSKPKLTVTPEIVRSVEPNKIAKKIIHDAAKKFGSLEDYSHFNFGSCWYVELPRYINRLVGAGKLKKAKRDAEACFRNEKIPQKILR